ncbi:putative 3-ketoacyl-CoA synthase 9 [Blattamonas nauphoetae]|uniref:very-long-chain 3-oxoacyl-CoA synthase n=1 Tax=Blattamonas nauphoetae TaxID=2049346 RepID=A0ABQ9XXS3_9EUKA|nr:putative 3-ketoacyl-CoA synthase 9 [Blattamonas nauphoetae]
MENESLLHRPRPLQPHQEQHDGNEITDNILFPAASPSLFDPDYIPTRTKPSLRTFDESDWAILVLILSIVFCIGVRWHFAPISFTALFWPGETVKSIGSLVQSHNFAVFLTFLVLIMVTTWSVLRHGRSVYVLDHICWQPPNHAKVPHDLFIQKATASGAFSEESLNFQKFLLNHNGLSDETYLPPLCFDPHHPLRSAIDEATTGIFSALDLLFSEHASFDPRRDLDLLIVSCASFTVQPSICARIANRYKLKPSHRAYELSGMGASGGMLGIDLANEIMLSRDNLHAVVVSTDNCCSNFYFGDQHDYLVANTMWRWGVSAALLSNTSKSRQTARYKLLKSIRTNCAFNDSCFSSIQNEEDEFGQVGLRLSRTLRKPMGVALRMNINQLCPYIIGAQDQLLMTLNRMLSLFSNAPQRKKRYTINFTKYINHFCIHAGGLKLIADIKHNLHLNDEQISPPLSTLFRYGLLSGSSQWYQLALLERKKKINRGDKIWQLSYGSGFVVVSATWLALKGSEREPLGQVWPEALEDPEYDYVKAYREWSAQVQRSNSVHPESHESSSLSMYINEPDVRLRNSDGIILIPVS